MKKLIYNVLFVAAVMVLATAMSCSPATETERQAPAQDTAATDTTNL